MDYQVFELLAGLRVGDAGSKLVSVPGEVVAVGVTFALGMTEGSAETPGLVVVVLVPQALRRPISITIMHRYIEIFFI